MKKTAFITLLFLAQNAAYSQASDYSKIAVTTAEECKKAEPQVLEAVNFILSKPVCNQDALSASLFNIKWMEKTDYTFNINKKVSNLSDKKKNPLLIGVYFACLTKFVLENPDKAKDDKTVQLGACALLATFIEKKDNDVVMTKSIQKFLDASKQGKMETYLGY